VPSSLIKTSYKYKLPSDANVQSGQLVGAGAMLYLSAETGGLCACCSVESGYWSSGSAENEEVRSLRCVPITPITAPYIHGFTVLRHSAPDSMNESTAPLQRGSIILETSSGFKVCPFTHTEQNADSLVTVLQRACGGATGSRHPRSLISVADVLANKSGTTTAPHTAEQSGAVAKDDATVQALGAELAGTLQAHMTLASELQHMDDELVRLMALLDVLGNDRDGLQVHSVGALSSGSHAEDGLKSCAADTKGSSSSNAGISSQDAASALDWSQPLCNTAGTLTLTYRFRCEPTACDAGAPHDTCILLDVVLTAYTAAVGKALRDRTVLFSLAPATSSDSLHAVTETTSAVLRFKPSSHAPTVQYKERPNQRQECKLTFMVTSLTQLCEYRLALQVCVGGDPTTRYNVTDTEAVLCLVDHVIPQAVIERVVLLSPDYAAAQRLQRVIHDLNSGDPHASATYRNDRP
jgi:hypothetical protein